MYELNLFRKVPARLQARFQQGSRKVQGRLQARFQQGSTNVPARFQQGSSKAASKVPARFQEGSSKVPARLQARFQQGSRKVPARVQQGSSKVPGLFRFFEACIFVAPPPDPRDWNPTLSLSLLGISCYIPFFGLSNFALNQDYDCHGHNKQPYQKTHQTFPCCLSHCVFASLTMIYPHWT